MPGTPTILAIQLMLPCILLAVFSAYFKNVVVGGAEGTRLWGIAVGAAAIIVAILSPILGAIADVARSKKLFLGIFTAISIAFTAALFFVGPGDVGYGNGILYSG